MFSTSPTRPTTSTFALRPASAAISPTTAPAPAMSHFMSSIPPAGLMQMPPVSKVTPLPMNASGLAWLSPLPRAVPLHHHHARLVGAALRHAEQRAEAELLHLLRAEHLDLDAERAQRAAALRHLGRGRARWAARSTRSRVRNTPSATARSGAQAALAAAASAVSEVGALQLRLVLVLLRRAVAVEAVAAQQQRPARMRRRAARPEPRPRTPPRGSARQRAARAPPAASSVLRAAVRLAEPDRDHLRSRPAPGTAQMCRGLPFGP